MKRWQNLRSAPQEGNYINRIAAMAEQLPLFFIGEQTDDFVINDQFQPRNMMRK